MSVFITTVEKSCGKTISVFVKERSGRKTMSVFITTEERSWS